MASKRMRLTCPTILDLPNEILMKIIGLAGSDGMLSQTCSRFNELISAINAKNLSMSIETFNLINPMFDLGEFIKSAEISLKIDRNCRSLNQIELFFQTFGHQVTKLAIDIDNFPSKFLSMLPNLEDLELNKSLSTDGFVSEDFQNPLRRLKVGGSVDLNHLDFTVLDELELHQSLGDLSAKTFSLLKCEKLKKLNLVKCEISYGMKESINRLQLESFRYQFGLCKSQQILALTLKFQRHLRELMLDDNVSVYVWTVICEDLRRLESLTVGFRDDFCPDHFRKISSLKLLKSLKIVCGLNRGCFNALLTRKFEALTSLSMVIDIDMSSYEIARLARNFQQLTSLSITFKRSVALGTIWDIFTQFNKLESLVLVFSLNLTFSENDLKQFHAEDHRNLNLKSLKFLSFEPHQEMHIRKFIRDFPNLEAIGLNPKSYSRHNLELLLTGLRNLKTINQLSIDSDELLAGENLNEFLMDINLLQDPSEMLKDFNVTFHELNSLSKITKTKKGEKKMIVLNFHDFSRWQKIRIMMDSTRRVRHLTVILTNFPNKAAFDPIIECIKAIGVSVTTLTVEKVSSLPQLQRILEAIPTVESLTVLKADAIVDTEVCRVCNVQLSSFSINFNRIKYYHTLMTLENLFRGIKFADDTLTSFKLALKIHKRDDGEVFAERLEKHLENQRKLTKQSEAWNDKTWMYTIELASE